MHWRLKVDVADLFEDLADGRITFGEAQWRVVSRLQQLPIHEDHGWDDVDVFNDIVDALAYAESQEEFDDYWDELYDWADEHALWVNTLSILSAVEWPL
jgi:hypothetical protein